MYKNKTQMYESIVYRLSEGLVEIVHWAHYNGPFKVINVLVATADVAGTPAKRGRGRPRKCPVHDEPAIKLKVLTPGFRRVDRETTPVEVEEVEEPERETIPVEEVGQPAKRKRGRPPIHRRQAGTKSSVRQDRIIFVSQRRPVTESEKDDAVAAAYSAAARMQSPCIVFVLKPSSVYKNFALVSTLFLPTANFFVCVHHSYYLFPFLKIYMNVLLFFICSVNPFRVYIYELEAMSSGRRLSECV